MDKLLGQNEDAGPPKPDANNLENTAYQADGEGLPNKDGETHRKWYGKKEKNDGLKTEKKSKDRQKVCPL